MGCSAARTCACRWACCSPSSCCSRCCCAAARSGASPRPLWLRFMESACTRYAACSVWSELTHSKFLRFGRCSNDVDYNHKAPESGIYYRHLAEQAACLAMQLLAMVP